MTPAEIKSLQDKFNLTYHVPYALAAEQRVGLRGKRVLEIGGSLPRDFVLGVLGAEQWIGVEELDYYRESHTSFSGREVVRQEDVETIDELGDYGVVSVRAECLDAKFNECFDVVFSIASFEHLTHLPAALTRMYHSLKPGGRLFTLFAPIWSAHDGHHLHGVTDKTGRTFSFLDSPIPPWGHLLMRPPQMYRFLLMHTDADAASEIVYQIYHSTAINRLFAEDYVEYFTNSPFKVNELVGKFQFMPPEPTGSHLQLLHPGRKRFDHNGLLAVMTR